MRNIVMLLLLCAGIALSACPIVRGTGRAVESVGEGVGSAVSETGEGIGDTLNP